MNIAIDVDGTIDAFPRVFQSLISALASAGHRVYVITGVEGTSVTQADVDTKTAYLASMGITMQYAVIVCPKPHAPNKVDIIQENDIDLFIDNNKDNIKAAVADGCASLLLWNGKSS